MEYPHKKYLLYLLSRQMEVADIRADCVLKGLIPPDDTDLTRLYHYELGELPSFWRGKITRENVKFRRWLRDKGIMNLWQKDVATEKAFDFLYKKALRKDFEAIVLAHGDIALARSELLVKYRAEMVPEETTLMRFYEIFWNVGAMSSEGIMGYINAEEARESYLPALQGDLVTIYGQLGLQQRLRGETMLQNIMEMANQQTLLVRGAPEGNGAWKAGTSSLIKLGLEAFKLQTERDVIDAADIGVKEEAADFLAAMVQAREIPSIDDIERGDVIDAEYAEAGNVHRLPVRGK